MGKYIITNNELYHYGVKGMKWGVRRYQNKDGSLTSAGKKRLVESLRKDFKKTVTGKHATDASKIYQRNVADAANRGLTIKDKKMVIDAKKKLISAVEKADEADKILSDLSEEYAFDYYNKQMDSHPEKYNTDKANDELMLYALNEYGYNKAIASRPDLAKALREKDSCYDAFIKSCRDASDKLLGEYGDMQLYDFGPIPLTVKDSIFNTIVTMDFDINDRRS